MLLYYVRHGDPIYDPDSLTELGKRQAEAVAKRLSVHGIDEIYASTSNRAILTAKPTSEILKKEINLLDFANEAHAWNELTYEENGSKSWLFHNRRICELFLSREIRNLGDEWYTHPEFNGYDYKKGIDRIYNESGEFFKLLGYEHIRGTGTYKVLKSNPKRIAIFAHQGFGLSFLSCLLDIPYPTFTTHFDMCHSGVTVINFHEANGLAIPVVYSLSNDSHIYKEGLPTNYNNVIRL